MASAACPDPEGRAHAAGGACPPAEGARGRERRRVRVVQGGPVLVEGPVEIVLEDGSTAVSDRFMVALCACRRSRSYPFCDTSHRRRARPADGTAAEGAQEGRPS
ncbi:CDGSH iron-sulfur domain-containing protein [Actinomadura graeca]|uniref:CDGSH iron-sulfur domain-containing protein n=1 Tax=Actinomadura graeca TaxID=2750812 RepID=A0ABX8R5D1_9ACTN|nr:CDGSH iron-sulfur domain-containing protein [Actinomadura graeca]